MHQSFFFFFFIEMSSGTKSFWVRREREHGWPPHPTLFISPGSSSSQEPLNSPHQWRWFQAFFSVPEESRTFAEQKETLGAARLGPIRPQCLLARGLESIYLFSKCFKLKRGAPRGRTPTTGHFSGGDSGTRGNEYPAHPLGSRVQCQSPKLWD